MREILIFLTNQIQYYDVLSHVLFLNTCPRKTVITAAAAKQCVAKYVHKHIESQSALSAFGCIYSCTFGCYNIAIQSQYSTVIPGLRGTVVFLPVAYSCISGH